MKNLKRIFLAVVLALALVLVVACGSTTEVTLSGISITTQPNKVSYVEGETFDKTGMVVTATYSDDSTKIVTDYEFSPAGALQLSDTKVTITYKEKTAQVAISVKSNEPDLTSIETVFGYKNNTEIKVQAVVFEVVEGGFYVADSANGHIFVNNATEVKIGDQVEIIGKYGYITYYPTIKDVKSIKTLATGVASPVTFEETTIAALSKASEEEPQNYAKLVKVTEVNVGKDAAGAYFLSDIDNNKLYFDEATDGTKLAEFENKRVDAELLLTRYISGLCYVHFSSQSSVVENKVTLEDVMKIAKDHLDSKIPATIYGKINLPTSHPTVPGMTYEWASNNEAIAIVDNAAQVVLGETDTTVTLTVTVINGELSGTLEYVVESKAIVEQSLSSLLANLPEVDGSVVKTYGVVLGKFRNQGGGVRGVFLQDQTTKESVLVQFNGAISYTSEEFASLEVGDLIYVTAQYDYAGSDWAPRISNVQSLRVEGKAEYAHQYESAYTLETLEQYADFNRNIDQYAGKLVKIVNPYLCYSKANPSPTNWMTFSPDFVKYNDYNNGEAGCPTYTYAFLLVAQDEALGSTAWRDNLPVPSNEVAVTQLEITVYAYLAVYGPTYAQFIIVTPEFIQYNDSYNTQIRMQAQLPTAVNAGDSITLPTEFEGHAITWTSVDGNINVETGAVKGIEESTISTLTASIENVGEFSFNIAITAITPVEIADIRSLPVGTTVYVRGIVTGLHTANQSTSAIELLIKDEDSNEIIGVTGVGDQFGSHMKKVDTAAEDVLGSTQSLTWGPVKLGDVLLMPVTVNATGSYQDAQKVTVAFAGTKLEDYVVDSGRAILVDKTDEKIITITSQEELGNFMLTATPVDPEAEEITYTYDYVAAKYQIVKLSGTIKAICYNGSSTASKQSPYLRFFFEASALAEQRFADKKQVSPCFMTAFNNMSFASGSLYTEVFVGQGWTKEYATPLTFEGDLYAVYVGGNSSSNYGCFIILGNDAVVASVAE